MHLHPDPHIVGRNYLQSLVQVDEERRCGLRLLVKKTHGESSSSGSLQLFFNDCLTFRVGHEKAFNLADNPVPTLFNPIDPKHHFEKSARDTATHELALCNELVRSVWFLKFLQTIPSPLAFSPGELAEAT
ncbi:hypothetical protein BFJ70_g8308 [Fusarium oxysporum]|nr:hypothetical protein BFJ70_g8308 [Fusarium oxysporum]